MEIKESGKGEEAGKEVNKTIYTGEVSTMIRMWEVSLRREDKDTVLLSIISPSLNLCSVFMLSILCPNFSCKDL